MPSIVHHMKMQLMKSSPHRPIRSMLDFVCIASQISEFSLNVSYSEYLAISVQCNCLYRAFIR